jgi:hypothetical protein
MVGEVASWALPQPRVDAGGGDAAGLDVERVGGRARERVAHAYLPWRTAAGVDAHVAAAVDRTAAVASEPHGQQVGRPPFDGARQV